MLNVASQAMAKLDPKYIYHESTTKEAEEFLTGLGAKLDEVHRLSESFRKPIDWHQLHEPMTI